MRPLLFLCALLGGCATGVVPTGQGTYMASKTSAGGVFVTPDGSAAYVYEQARSFCAEKGLEVETIELEKKNAIPFVRQTSATLRFRCEPKK